MKRSSGILMPLYSLPSPYGIGTMGKAAYEFIDFLSDAGQSWWQMLPMGPTGYGDSPYQSFSSYAGNPYFIDLDMLVLDGLLEKEELEQDWGGEPQYVDYGKIYDNRFKILEKAFERGFERDKGQVEVFKNQNAGWLSDYALYMALKRHFSMKAWTDWDKDIKMREPDAVSKYKSELKRDTDFFVYLQFLFYKQWDELKEYAHGKGIGIIGDMPIYAAMDSADVWSEQRFFSLDSDGYPTEVSGVPPDAFSDDGQLWGNPLYNWQEMKKDGYGWWIRRVDGLSRLFDVIRVDHFRGFAGYWSVPYGSDTAKNGKWNAGPGMDLVDTLTGWFPNVKFIAEDLGVLTDDVTKLLEDSGLPGMRVLEFAFGSDSENEHLPHNYKRNCICYTATHDNETVIGWESNPENAQPVAAASDYFAVLPGSEFNWELIKGGMRSVADVFVAQIQDYLGLGPEGRTNEPSTASGNWRWRLQRGMITKELAEKIRTITEIYGRL